MATLVADPKVQENPRDLQTLCVWGCWWEGHGWVFPFSLQRFLNKKSSLDNWELFGISPGSCASPGVDLCLFPRPCLLSNLCNHCIRPAHCLSLRPLAWGADESQVPHTGRPREFPPEDCPAEKHSGQYCISSPQRQAAPSLPLGLILLSL